VEGTTSKTSLPTRHVSFLSALWLSFALLMSPGWTQSLDAPFKLVVFPEGSTLRDVVADELSDPDLWPLVLKLSDIRSITDVRPGTVLAMPVQQVKVTDGALSRALEAIQAANAEGARLFAPSRIEAAIEHRDEAVIQRGSGEWRGAVTLADTATGFANEALQVSLAQRDRDAEALVTDVQGDVEGRSPQASKWTDRALNDVLVQAERVRTLSGSTTQITFRDLSRLRLNPNSNATIQRMRSDPLTGGEVTQIELVSGDFYALLNQLGDRTSFQIDAGGLQTQTDSTDFWIKTDETGARFANYDAAALVVGTGQNAVSLGENEGAVVNASGVAQVTEVLDRPALLGPADKAPVYGRSAQLSWVAKAESAGYWLEVAADAGFNNMRVSEWGIPTTGFEVAGLDQGRYHWRVAALDAFGLPGSWSLAQSFELISDSTPPFLALSSPTEGALIAEASLTVAGESEPGVTLTLNGDPGCGQPVCGAGHGCAGAEQLCPAGGGCGGQPDRTDGLGGLSPGRGAGADPRCGPAARCRGALSDRDQPAGLRRRVHRGRGQRGAPVGRKRRGDGAGQRRPRRRDQPDHSGRARRHPLPA